jgi:hypothetical protein
MPCAVYLHLHLRNIYIYMIVMGARAAAAGAGARARRRPPTAKYARYKVTSTERLSERYNIANGGQAPGSPARAGTYMCRRMPSGMHMDTGWHWHAGTHDARHLAPGGEWEE